MRVKLGATGLYTYPDVVVVCGEPTFEDAEVDTLLTLSFLLKYFRSRQKIMIAGGNLNITLPCLLYTNISL
jgi:hypothetical protein